MFSFLFVDHLFGSCQSVYRAPDGYQYNLDSTSLQTLEAEIYRLINQGYTWDHLYTQCVLGNILLAYRRRAATYDPNWCDKPEVPLSDALDSAALRDLERYFEAYYDAVNAGNDVTNDVDFRSDDVVDIEPPFIDAAERAKKDELISVHKYFAPKRAENELYGAEAEEGALGDDLDEMLGRLGEDDIDALRWVFVSRNIFNIIAGS